MNVSQLVNALKEPLHIRFTHHNYLRAVSENKRAFPFKVDPSKAGQVSSDVFARNVATISITPSQAPRMVLMLPVVLPDTQAKLNRLISKFWKESSESEETRKRVFLVIGINCRRGVDSAKLNTLYDFIQKVQKQAHAVFVMGFSWDAEYELLESRFKYDIYKAFRILKLIDPSCAEGVRAQMDGTKVNVPYINIREAILTSRAVAIAFNKFKVSPTYLGIMDPDADNFNRVVDGAFHEIEAYRIKNGYLPDIFGSGYEAAPSESEVIKLGLKLDRKTRAETNAIIGGGSYISEVFMLFLVKTNPLDFSFLTAETKKDQTLESRRLIQNALRSNQISQDRFCYGGNPVITSVMDRMRTAFTALHQPMESQNLYSMKALRCICGLTYNHFDPRTWANNLYPFINVKAANITLITGPIQKLFKAVHPIYAAKEALGEDFTPEQFKDFLFRFTAYLETIREYWEENEINYPLMDLDETLEEYERVKETLSEQIDIIDQVWLDLYNQGFSKERINDVYVAAFNSAQAARCLLLKGQRGL